MRLEEASEPLGYARTNVDAERDLTSLDRAMTVRLSRTFGLCLMLFGIVITLSFGTQRGFYGIVAWAPLIPIALCILPGILLLCCVPALQRGSRAAAIVVLIAGLWSGIGFGLGTVGLALAVMRFPTARMPDQFFQLAIFSLLALATAKLLYHTIRLLVAPGRGASQEAVQGVIASIGGGSNELAAGLSRLGMLRFISGTFATLAALAVLAMSQIVPPAPPPPPPVVPPPFTDLYDTVNGLSAPERAMVIAHFEQYRALNAGQKQALDDVLRELGRTIVNFAAMPQRFGRLFPPAPNPLTPAAIAERLEIDKSRSDEATASDLTGPDVLRIYFGGWYADWAAGPTFRLTNDHKIWGAETHEPPFGDYVSLKGDLWRADISSNGQSGIAWHWSNGAIQRLLDQANAKAGSPARITDSQAHALAAMIAGSGVQDPIFRKRSGPIPIPFEATLNKDGLLALSINGYKSLWFWPDGTMRNQPYDFATRPDDPSPILESSPIASISFAITSLIAAVAGLLLMTAMRRASESRIEKLLVTHVIITIIGAAAIAWMIASIWHANPRYQRIMRSVSAWLPLAFVAIWMLLVGIIAPITSMHRQSDHLQANANGR